MPSPHAQLWFFVIVIFSCSFVSLLPSSYHKLMVAEYKSKWEKFQAAKWWATDEWKPVKEMERIMDMELFLGIQDWWAEDSPHHTVILYEMFRHVAANRQKEAERVICQGCWQNLPQLNPEAGIPAIQLVGLETTKEELLELYLEVYKLHRVSSRGASNTWRSAVLPPRPPKMWGRRGSCSHGMAPCWRLPFF